MRPHFYLIIFSKATRAHDKKQLRLPGVIKNNLCGVNDTVDLFTYANISAKSKPYATILMHINKGPRWVRIMRAKKGIQIL